MNINQRNLLTYLDDRFYPENIYLISPIPDLRKEKAEETLNHLSIYPDPAYDKATIQCNLTNGEILIYDLNGRLILNHKIANESSFMVQASDLGNDHVYFVTLRQNGKVLSSKKLLFFR